MREDREDDEYNFEEATLYDSEWFEYFLYSVAIIVIGFLITPILSFDPQLEIHAESLQKSLITVGFGCAFFCLFKLATESGLFSKEPPQPISEVADDSTEKNIDSSSFHTQKAVNVYFPRKLTQQILDEMEWLRFEQICSAYFTLAGYKNALTGLGADGGIDIKIFDAQSSELVSIVQCKRHNNPVSVKDVREFYGVMSSQDISKGYFITTSSFNKNAVDFASSLNIDLVDGRELLLRFSELSDEAQTRLYDIATHGDYKTPSCVKCGAKMIQRKNKKTGEPFWTCRKYGCKSTLRIKSN
ncbi:MAG TPA: restriction endonuclease [Methylophilus sp.]|nr:restriction endonuclease [Methylophilus sp.]HQQ34237.1 restriction endonuclease [Methylophilus sp.]